MCLKYITSNIQIRINKLFYKFNKQKKKLRALFYKCCTNLFSKPDKNSTKIFPNLIFISQIIFLPSLICQ